MDPAEVRRKNFIREFPYITASEFDLDSGDYSPRSSSAWTGSTTRRSAGARGAGREGPLPGVGMAFTSSRRPTEVRVGAQGRRRQRRLRHRMRVEPDGKVRLAVGLHSHGQGHETTMAQIVADQLGLPVEDIRVIYGDTGSVPYGMGTYASRGTVYCGGATILAARDIREKATKIAAHLLEANPDDLEISAAASSRSRATRRRALARRGREVANHERPAARGDRAGLDSPHKYCAERIGTFANAVHVVEVEVDLETGELTIGKLRRGRGLRHGHQPAGGRGPGTRRHRPGHRRRASSRSWSTTMPGSCSRARHGLPAARVHRRPRRRHHHLETPSPINVGGFKGMGEGGCINVMPAIANAVIDALKPIGEVQINTSPITARVSLQRSVRPGGTTEEVVMATDRLGNERRCRPRQPTGGRST